MSDSSPVDYRILAVLQEWVCQYPMLNINNMRHRLIDRQTAIDQAIGSIFWLAKTNCCYAVWT